MEQRFYKCSHCGKIVAIVKETGVPVMCCGQVMNEIIAGSTDEIGRASGRERVSA